MRSETRYNSLREFIEIYPRDEKMINHLWKNYFLKQQDAKTQKILQDIYDEFGVYVCMDGKVASSTLYYLKHEFRMWKEKGGDVERFPKLFDMRRDYYLFKNKGKYATYC